MASILILRMCGDPRHWRAPGPAPTVLRFINTSKYPASLQFLLMTLGPTILLLPLAERACGKIGEIFAVFGRVPMFYYLIHHSDDSPRGRNRLARARRKSQSVADGESSGDGSARTRGLHVESFSTLRGVLRRGGGALCALPLVCPTKGDRSGAVDALHLRLPHARLIIRLASSHALN